MACAKISWRGIWDVTITRRVQFPVKNIEYFLNFNKQFIWSSQELETVPFVRELKIHTVQIYVLNLIWICRIWNLDCNDHSFLATRTHNVLLDAPQILLHRRTIFWPVYSRRASCLRCHTKRTTMFLKIKGLLNCNIRFDIQVPYETAWSFRLNAALQIDWIFQQRHASVQICLFVCMNVT